MPSYCCKHSRYVVAYLHEVVELVVISCIRLLLANYLLIVAKKFSKVRAAKRRHGPRPAGRGPRRAGSSGTRAARAVLISNPPLIS